jgi:hypothetical protein
MDLHGRDPEGSRNEVVAASQKKISEREEGRLGSKVSLQQICMLSV